MSSAAVLFKPPLRPHVGSAARRDGPNESIPVEHLGHAEPFPAQSVEQTAAEMKRDLGFAF